jgi:hypothetical protein
VKLDCGHTPTLKNPVKLKNGKNNDGKKSKFQDGITPNQQAKDLQKTAYLNYACFMRVKSHKTLMCNKLCNCLFSELFSEASSSGRLLHSGRYQSFQSLDGSGTLDG